MTKKAIIELLKQYEGKPTTIAYNGLSSTQAVDKARAALIEHWEAAVESHNAEHPDQNTVLEVTGRSISAGSSFAFLPQYPRIGILSVKSKEFIIDSVYCRIVDIMADTFDQTDKTFGFGMKSGSFIVVTK